MEFDAGGDMTAWTGIAYAAISALLGWIWKIQSTMTRDREEMTAKITAVELDLAKNYHDSAELEKALSSALAPVLAAIARLERAIENRGGGSHGSN